MPSPMVLSLVEDWAKKHRIENASEWAKADLASMIDAFARKSDSEKEGDSQPEWDPPA